jgi:lysophospholipase L1-like esterase
MADTIPADDKTVGSGNPPADMNDVADVLALITGEPPGTTLVPGQVPLVGQTVTVQGVAGATAGTRAAGATVSGPPVSGTYLTGDTATDQTGKTWIRTPAGVWTTERLQAAQALTPFRAALGNRASARCNVVCVGDSITEGQHATSETLRWLACLRVALRSRFPFTGQPAGGRGFIGCSNTSTIGESFTWPVTKAGSPSIVNQGPKGGDGSASAAYQLNATGQSFTFSLNGDSADIMWVQVGFGGTFSWQVDSGATTNVSTNGGSTADGKITHISLGSAGAHTLKLAWVSGNATVDGVTEYNGDLSAGIQVHDCGHFGWTSSSWVTSLGGGTVAGPAAAVAALNPAAVVISLGVNDQFANTAPATFGSNLQTIISGLKARLTSPYPSFILNMYPPRTGQSGYTFPWSQYVAAAWAVAAADTSGPGGTSVVTVMDFTQGPRLPGADTDVYSVWQSGDNVHPSNLGHQAIADTLTWFLACA